MITRTSSYVEVSGQGREDYERFREAWITRGDFSYLGRTFVVDDFLTVKPGINVEVAFEATLKECL